MRRPALNPNGPSQLLSICLFHMFPPRIFPRPLRALWSPCINRMRGDAITPLAVSVRFARTRASRPTLRFGSNNNSNNSGGGDGSSFSIKLLDRKAEDAVRTYRCLNIDSWAEPDAGETSHPRDFPTSPRSADCPEAALSTVAQNHCDQG